MDHMRIVMLETSRSLSMWLWKGKSGIRKEMKVMKKISSFCKSSLSLPSCHPKDPDAKSLDLS